MSLHGFSNVKMLYKVAAMAATVAVTNVLTACGMIGMPYIPDSDAHIPVPVPGYSAYNAPNLVLDAQGNVSYSRPEKGIYIRGHASNVLYVAQEGNYGNFSITASGEVGGASFQGWANSFCARVTRFNNNGTNVTIFDAQNELQGVEKGAERAATFGRFSQNGAQAPGF